MPSAHRSSGTRLALSSATRTTSTTLRQISCGSCSTQPGLGKCSRCPCYAIDTTRARSSKTKHLDDTVPWSTEATYRPRMLKAAVYAPPGSPGNRAEFAGDRAGRLHHVVDE